MLRSNNSKIRWISTFYGYGQEEYDLHNRVILAQPGSSMSSGTHKRSHVRRMLNAPATIVNVGLQNGDAVDPTQRPDQSGIDMSTEG